MSYLIAKSDDGRDIAVPIREPLEIGRGDKDFIVVAKTRGGTVSLETTDATVSKTHARIYLESGKLMLRDMGSKNGTFLNNNPLPGSQPGRESDPVEIRENSNIKFGYNTIVRIALGEKTITPEEWEKIKGISS
jgi:pSer/pThr/pTyr-binding forkhead associated (FHA) protein